VTDLTLGECAGHQRYRGRPVPYGRAALYALQESRLPAFV